MICRETRVYAAGPDGRCTICHRPEDEHAPQAWSDDPRLCPPERLCVIARYQDLIVEWRTATREHAKLNRKEWAFETDEQRVLRHAAMKRLERAELALVRSVPEVAR